MRRQEAIEDQALDWLMRRDAPDWTEREQDALDAWLEESIAHKAAFWRADHGWRQAGRIRSLGPDYGEPAPVSAWRRWWPAAMAASLVAAVVGGNFALAPHLHSGSSMTVQESRFHTALGDRRLVSLEDGSQIELNTQTALRTAISSGRREVWLDAGEAFFEVAHRDGQPFVVHAGPQTITVLGTKFSVRRDQDRVTVNVLEGRVQVRDSDSGNAHAAIITAGDTANSRGGSTLIATKSDKRVENALAWREGMLRFDQTPLSEVAAEFNRYNRTQLIVADSGAASIPIGGAFKAANVESFTRLLHDAYGLHVERDSGSMKISSQ